MLDQIGAPTPSRMTSHCRDRCSNRSIPVEAVYRALEQPFLSGTSPGDTSWGLVRAVCGSRWQFVMVVWTLRDGCKIAITAYHPNREKLLNNGG
jgi:hypothetical protein